MYSRSNRTPSRVPFTSLILLVLLATTVAAQFTPPAGLELWLKAEDLALADGAPVVSWPDASGNGRDLSATFGTPVYVASATTGELSNATPINSPVVRFSGQRLENVSAHNAQTVIFVLKQNAASSVTYSRDGGCNEYFGSVGDGNVYFSSPFIIWSGGAASVVNGAYHVLSGLHQDPANGNSGSIYMDGVLRASGSGAVTVTGLTDVVGARRLCGAPGNYDKYLNGDVAELLVFSTDLSAVDRAAVETYLTEKYIFQSVPLTCADFAAKLAERVCPEVLAQQPANQAAVAAIADQIITDLYAEYGPPSDATEAACRATLLAALEVPCFVELGDGSLFVPPEGLELWLRGDTVEGVADGGSLSLWPDASGYGRDVTTTSATDPTWLAAEQTGETFGGSPLLQPVVRFAGQRLENGDLHDAQTVIFLARQNAANSVAYSRDGGCNEYFGSVGDGNYYFSTPFIVWSGGAAVVADSEFHVLSGLHQDPNNSGSGSIYMDSVLRATGTGATTVSDLGDVIGARRLCNGVGYDQYYNGDIVEVMVFSTDLTAAERSAVETYLTERYLLAPETLTCAEYAPLLDERICAELATQQPTTEAGILAVADQIITDLFGQFGPPSDSTEADCRAALLADFSAPCWTVQEDCSLFVPPSGLELWLRADAISDVADGAGLAAWPDLSGFDRDLTATAGLPTFQAATTTGVRADASPLNNATVRFSGGQIMNNAGSTHDAQTIMLVTRFNSAGVPYTRHGGLNEYVGSVGDGNLYLKNPQTVWSGGQAAVIGGFHVISGLYRDPANSNSGSLYLDGVLQATGTGGTSPTELYDEIGARWSITSYNLYFSGDIAEVLVFSSDLDAADRAAVEDYLLAKYAASPVTCDAIEAEVAAVACDAFLDELPTTLAAARALVEATLDGLLGCANLDPSCRQQILDNLGL